MFKRAVVFAGVFVAAAMAFAGSANAAATSGKVELKGSIAAVCQISVTNLGQSLDLVSGEKSRKVASVEEHCNDHDGYTVSFSSSNKGALQNNQGDKVSYSINYDSSSNQSLSGGHTLRRSTAQFRKSFDLTVNLDASATRIAGDYSDTITVTIQAN